MITIGHHVPRYSPRRASCYARHDATIPAPDVRSPRQHSIDAARDALALLSAASLARGSTRAALAWTAADALWHASTDALRAALPDHALALSRAACLALTHPLRACTMLAFALSAPWPCLTTPVHKASVNASADRPVSTGLRECADAETPAARTARILAKADALLATLPVDPSHENTPTCPVRYSAPRQRGASRNARDWYRTPPRRAL